jgi:hypothetical protein
MVSPARYDGLADWYETWSQLPAVAGFSDDAAAGAHPCFVGPYAHRTYDGVVPPGYFDERLHFDAPGFGDGVRRQAGARHVPLAALLNHVAAARLVLEHAEELRDDPPGILALRAVRW